MGLQRLHKIVEPRTLTGPLRLYNTMILMKETTNYNMGQTTAQRARPFPTHRASTTSGRLISLMIMKVLHHPLFITKIVQQSQGFRLAKKIVQITST